MTAVDDKVQELADNGFTVGDPITDQGKDDTGRCWQQFTNAWLMAEPDGTCWTIWGATLDAYNRTGSITRHGYPTTSQTPTGRDDITTWDFTAGSRIYEIGGDTGTSYELSPPMLTTYDTLGGPTGELGGPAMDETADPTTNTWWAQFENGDALYETPNGVCHLTPTIQTAYWNQGGPASTLGIPLQDSDTDPGGNGEACIFTNGTLFIAPDGTTTIQPTGTTTPPIMTPTAGGWPRFATGVEADAWFAAHTTQSTFIDWFIANHANQGAWAGKTTRASAHGDFITIFSDMNLLVDRADLTLPELLSLGSVMINETGGTFRPISERVGTAAHPGIAYAFDAGGKASYNAAPNRTAFTLFNDADFLGAHQNLPLAAAVTNTTDQRWAGTVYPVGDFPTSTDPAIAGIILEADFYKFRGRGVIQNTWRPAYLTLVRFVQAYGGSDPVLTSYATAWNAIDPDTVASRSTNADWDTLFQNTNLEVAREAVRQHNASKNHHFWLSEDRAVLDGDADTPATVRRAGYRVSGSKAYGDTLHDRVFQLLTGLGL